MRSGLLALGLSLILTTGSFGQAVSEGAQPGDSTKVKRPKGPAHVTLQPYFAISSGYTKYEMDMSGYVGDTFMRVRSELEFPLDVTVLGANLVVEFPDQRWSIEGGGFVGVNDPSGRFKDGDWITIDTISYLQNLQFGYTESRTEISLYQFQAGLDYQALRSRALDLDGRAGLRYQHIEQNALGYEGTYVRYWEAPPLPVDTVASAQKAITYRVNYSICYLGFRAESKLASRLQINLGGAACYFWVSDFDDHLLRGKTGKADGTGTGGIGSFDLIYWFDEIRSKVRPFVSLNGEVLSLSSTMRQTQHWYRDEPVIGGVVPAGTTVPGIHHKITTQQMRIGGSVGIRF